MTTYDLRKAQKEIRDGKPTPKNKESGEIEKDATKVGGMPYDKTIYSFSEKEMEEHDRIIRDGKDTNTKCCVSCGREYQMPKGFMGTILCEDCDPFMNGTMKAKLTPQDGKPTIEEIRKRFKRELTYMDSHIPPVRRVKLYATYAEVWNFFERYLK